MNTFRITRSLALIVFSAVFYILLTFVTSALAQEAPTSTDVTVSETSITSTSTDETQIDVITTDAFIAPTVISEVATDTITQPEITPLLNEDATPVTTLETPIEATASTPELSTDKDDYHPGETATIFGRFFAPLTNFVLKIFGSDENNQNYTETEEVVETDETGFFTFDYLLDSLYRPFYEVVVSTLTGDKVAETWFRDGAVDAYDQCSNDLGTGYTTGDTGCRWINGAINSANSTYYEGDSTVQRVSLKGFAPSSSHTVTFTYGTTKAAKHAYDFLTTWNASENPITLADRCDGITGCTSATDATSTIPVDSNAEGLDVAFGSRLMTIRGGTISSVSVPALVSGSYGGGDSETSITVSFTVPASGPMCSTSGGGPNAITSCGVALFFGAHVAKGADWIPEDGFGGAGSIHGSPYHVAVTALDGSSIGQRDNQMSAGAIPSSITIRKQTEPNGSTQPFSFTVTGNNYTGFSLTDDGMNTQSVQPKNNNSKTYTITEGTVTDWTLSGISCENNNASTTITTDLANRKVTIVLDTDAGTAVDCTYTNTESVPAPEATLTLVKNLIKDNGGTANATDWTLTADSEGTDISGVTGSGAVTSATVLPGTFNLSESPAIAGYSASAWVCTGTGVTQDDSDTVTLDDGENATCTITNDDIAPKLHLRKVVTNDNGGNAVVGDFTLTANGAGSNDFSGTSPVDSGTGLQADTWALSESNVTGYTSSAWSCDAGTLVGSNLTLGIGQEATCTITNDDVAPTITLNKVVTSNNGGTAGVNDFGLTVGGAGVTSGEVKSVSANTPVALNEAGLTGYSFVSLTGDEKCPAVLGGTITLNEGENITCTITNDDIPAHLIVIKHVINNNGGTKTASDFSMTIGGVTATGGNTFNGVESPGTDKTLTTVGAYTVTEGAVTGYAQTSASADCSGTIALGETKTCTITNDDQTGTLIVHKVTNPADTTTQFTITASADSGQVVGTAKQTIAGGETESYTVHAGVYDVNESALGGWDMTGNTCVNVAVANGETKECTITNTKKGHLIVQKTTLPVGDTTEFSITASGGGTITGGGAGTITDANDKDYEVTPGTYSVAETVPTGWDKTADTCQGVVVGAGETKTCTITNTKRGSVTIVKDAINNNAQDFTFNNNFGNSNLATFTLDDDGPSGSVLPKERTFEVLPGTYSVSEGVVAGWQQESAICTDQSPVGAIVVSPGENVTCTFVNEEYAKIILIKNTIGGNGEFSFGKTGEGFAGTTTLTTVNGTASQTFADLDQDNSYSISETVPEGWTLVSATCTGGETPASISPEPGETVTCTFTNGKLPTLTLTKSVVNDNGGTKTTADFQGKIDGVNQVWGVAKTLTPGTYTASETTQTGYLASAWGTNCASNGSITLAYGDTKTCSITNDDIAPKLHLRKVVANDNGGTALDTAWTLTANGTDANDLTGSTPVDSGATLQADTFALNESGPTGYSASAWSCVGGTQDGSNITVGIGQEATCTITNDDNAPKLTLVKEVVKDNGGTAVATDWDLTATGPTSINGLGGVVSDAGFDAGAYTLTESAGPAGYTASAWSCSNNDNDGAISIGLGEEVTCTITNDDIQPKLTVTKVVINHGQNKVVSDFPLFVDTTSVTSGVQNGFNAGAHTVSETTDANYTSTITGDCASDGSITLGLADVKACTITNEEKPSKVVVHKVVINHGLENDATHFAPYVVGTTTVTLDATTTMNSGSYVVSEEQDENYTATYSGDCDAQGNITLVPGQIKSCTITNEEIPTHLTVVKNVIHHGRNDDKTHFAPYTIDSITVTEGASNLVNSGTHTVGENADTNYTQTFSTGCENGSIILLPGDDKTCTITNEEKLSDITVKKVVINHGQNKGVIDFAPYQVDTTAVTLDVPTVFNSGSHTVTEVIDPQYTQTFSGDCNADGIVVLGSGEHKTCTITNEEKPSKIVVTKVVINDNGGTKGVSDFPLFVGTSTVTSGATSTFNSGSYTISETNNDDYTATISGDCNPITGAVTLSAGETKTCTITNNDIPAEIHGMKYEDLNANGAKDSGENGLSGWTITLNPGNLTTTTDANGAYSFTGLSVGTYTVTEVQQTGWLQTSVNPAPISVNLADVVNDVNFGNFKLGKISGIKWNDTNGNGSKDTGEVGIAGWSITLFNGVGTTTAVTNASGVYTFTNLSLGTYTVREVQQAGWQQTFPALPGTYTISVTSGTDVSGKDFGNFKIPATRTQGFWQTHTTYTSGIFSTMVGDLTIGGKNINTTSKLFAGFYSSIPKLSVGGKRTSLDQARMQMLQQWLATQLNCKAFGCSIVTQNLLTNSANAWASNNKTLILSYASQLDAYNNSQDALPITGPTGSATPKASTDLAKTMYWFWDLLPN